MIKRILKKIADCINEHWVWKTLILFMPSVYLPVVVKYAGETLGLCSHKEKLTAVGYATTIVIYCTVFFINVLSSYKSKKDKENELATENKYIEEIKNYKNEIDTFDNTLHVYRRLLNFIGNICESKFNSICGYIDDSTKTGEFKKPFNETVHPDEQLKSIAKELKKCLSEITKPPVGNITVSIAYQFPGISKNFKWVDQQEIAQCMQLGALKKNLNTTFYKIFAGESNFLFYNDKRLASDKGEYVFDNKDKRHHNVGSIICDEIAIENENGKIARAILTISTYGYKFTDNTDDETLRNMSQMIEEVILQQFEKRIRIELALLYVKNQYNRK